MFIYQFSICLCADFLKEYVSFLYVHKPIFFISARPMRFLVQEGHTPWVTPRPVPSVPRERCVRMLTVRGYRPVSRGPTP